MSAADVREYLTMEDLLLQVEDDNDNNAAAARLISSADDSAQEWTAEALVPNILKARVNNKKRDGRSGTNNDLTTPLL